MADFYFGGEKYILIYLLLAVMANYPVIVTKRPQELFAFLLVMALTYQILSNGLENACDALRGLEKEKRRVFVHMGYNRNYFLIRIRNRCRDGLYVEQGELPVTNKEGADHGFGLAAIREAAKRLDGEIFCYTEDGDFILDVMVSCGAFPNAG